MCREVIGERHDACRAGTALATGHRHLSCKTSTGQGKRAGGNAVFAMGDGWMLGMNSRNHKNLKKIERQNTALKELVEIREEVGIYLNAPLLRGRHGNVEVRARSRLKRSSIVSGLRAPRVPLFTPDQTRRQGGAHHDDQGTTHHPMGDHFV